MQAKYALIIVFEYNLPKDNVNAPNPLLAMNRDLDSAWDLAVNRFNILRENITILTDIKSNNLYPWDPLRCDGCNPKIHRLKHPDIKIVIREMAQFIENTIRNVPEVIKGNNDGNEIFIYISGHGASIPNYNNGTDNALMFTCKKGTTRKYLRDEDIFKILFGHIPVNNDGLMTIPITSVEHRITDLGEKYSHYSTENYQLRITAVENRQDRGIPFDNNMLMIIDTCNSGDMPKFHYVYDSKIKSMKQIGNPISDIFPKCICLSATQSNNPVTSSLIGSPFTNYLKRIFHENKKTLTIEEIHDLIYKHLPPMLILAKPTITSTANSEKTLLPLMSNNHHNFKIIECRCKLCDTKIKCNCDM